MRILPVLASGLGVLFVALAVVAGCGDGNATYAYGPSYACLARVRTVDGVPAHVEPTTDLLLERGSVGDLKFVFDNSAVSANFFATPGEAKAGIDDYRRRAKAGEMGYSSSWGEELRRKGNVILDGPFLPDVVEHCLKRARAGGSRPPA